MAVARTLFLPQLFVGVGHLVGEVVVEAPDALPALGLEVVADSGRAMLATQREDWGRFIAALTQIAGVKPA